MSLYTLPASTSSSSYSRSSCIIGSHSQGTALTYPWKTHQQPPTLTVLTPVGSGSRQHATVHVRPEQHGIAREMNRSHFQLAPSSEEKSNTPPLARTSCPLTKSLAAATTGLLKPQEVSRSSADIRQERTLRKAGKASAAINSSLHHSSKAAQHSHSDPLQESATTTTALSGERTNTPLTFASSLGKGTAPGYHYASEEQKQKSQADYPIHVAQHYRSIYQQETQKVLVAAQQHASASTSTNDNKNQHANPETLKSHFSLSHATLYSAEEQRRRWLTSMQLQFNAPQIQVQQVIQNSKVAHPSLLAPLPRRQTRADEPQTSSSSSSGSSSGSGSSSSTSTGLTTSSSSPSLFQTMSSLPTAGVITQTNQGYDFVQHRTRAVPYIFAPITQQQLNQQEQQQQQQQQQQQSDPTTSSTSLAHASPSGSGSGSGSGSFQLGQNYTQYPVGPWEEHVSSVSVKRSVHKGHSHTGYNIINNTQKAR